MLNVMSLKAKEIGITNITQHCGDFLALPLKKKYDMIVSFSAIEYIQDIEALFDKIDELLKPGGYLILTTSHNTFFRWWGRMGNYFRQGIFMVAYSKKQMKKNLESRGIKILGIKDLCMKFLFVKGILLFVYARK